MCVCLFTSFNLIFSTSFGNVGYTNIGKKERERRCQVRGKKKENEKESSKERKGRQRESKNVKKMVSCHLMTTMVIIAEWIDGERKDDEDDDVNSFLHKVKSKKEDERDVDYCAIEVYWCEKGKKRGREYQT